VVARRASASLRARPPRRPAWLAPRQQRVAAAAPFARWAMQRRPVAAPSARPWGGRRWVRPRVSDPSAAGPSAAGPSAAGPSAAGPSAAGLEAGPVVQLEPDGAAPWQTSPAEGARELPAAARSGGRRRNRGSGPRLPLAPAARTHHQPPQARCSAVAWPGKRRRPDRRSVLPRSPNRIWGSWSPSHAW
jgi:hypothetical protein